MVFEYLQSLYLPQGVGLSSAARETQRDIKKGKQFFLLLRSKKCESNTHFASLKKKYTKRNVKWKWKSLSHVWLFTTPWTVACQTPLSMDFFRQEYRSGQLFPSPGDLPNPGNEPQSPASQMDLLPSGPSGKHRDHWNHFSLNQERVEDV